MFTSTRGVAPVRICRFGGGDDPAFVVMVRQLTADRFRRLLMGIQLPIGVEYGTDEAFALKALFNEKFCSEVICGWSGLTVDNLSMILYGDEVVSGADAEAWRREDREVPYTTELATYIHNNSKSSDFEDVIFEAAKQLAEENGDREEESCEALKRHVLLTQQPEAPTSCEECRAAMEFRDDPDACWYKSEKSVDCPFKEFGSYRHLQDRLSFSMMCVESWEKTDSDTKLKTQKFSINFERFNLALNIYGVPLRSSDPASEFIDIENGIHALRIVQVVRQALEDAPQQTIIAARERRKVRKARELDEA